MSVILQAGYLYWDGLKYITKVPALSNSASGDLSGNYPSPTVVALQGFALSGITPSYGQVLGWDGTIWKPTNLITSFIAGGDLSGSSISQTVIGFQGRPVSSTTPLTNQLLQYNGTNWSPTFVSSVLTLEQFGATGNGTLNGGADDIAMAAAVAALSGTPGTGFNTIQLAANRTYIINNSYNLPGGTTIQGQGWSSVIYQKTGLGNTFTTTGDYCTFRNFAMCSNGSNFTQTAITCQFANCLFTNLYIGGNDSDTTSPIPSGAFGFAKGICFTSFTGGTLHRGPIVSNCRFYQNHWNIQVGVNNSDAAQYIKIVGNQINGGAYGIDLEISANHLITSNTICDSSYGINIIALAGNDAHGIICGNQINHCGVYPNGAAIFMGPIIDGEFIENNALFDGDIWLVGSTGVVFNNNYLGGTGNGLWFDGSSSTWAGNSFTGTMTVNNNLNSHTSFTNWLPSNIDVLTNQYPTFLLPYVNKVFSVLSAQVINQPTTNNGTITQQFTITTSAATPNTASFAIPSNSAGLVSVIVTGANATDAGNVTWQGKVMNQAGVITVLNAFAAVDSWNSSSGASTWTVSVAMSGTTATITVTASSGAGTVNWTATLQYQSAAT